MYCPSPWGHGQRLWLDFKEAELISQPFTIFVGTWGKAKRAGIGSHALGQNLKNPAPEARWTSLFQSTAGSCSELKHAHPCAMLFCEQFLPPSGSTWREHEPQLSFFHFQDGILTKIHLLSCCKPLISAPRVSVPPLPASCCRRLQMQGNSNSAAKESGRVEESLQGGKDRKAWMGGMLMMYMLLWEALVRIKHYCQTDKMSLLSKK